MSAYPYNLLIIKPTVAFEPIGKWHFVYAKRKEALDYMNKCIKKGCGDYLFSVWNSEDETRLNPEHFNEAKYNDSVRWKERRWLQTN